MNRIFLALVVGSLMMPLVLQPVPVKADEPTPPEQPSWGPGGSDYPHGAVKESRYKWGARQYWIFEPDSPRPASAPLVVFNHGWSAFYPLLYIEWIHHIVKRGNIVVFPRYQKGVVKGFTRFASNAVRAVRDAIEELESGDHVRPELDSFAIVGHSLGGGITVHMAAAASDGELPVPKAIMPVQPAMPFGPAMDLSQIAGETLMVVLVGEDDTVVGDRAGRTIFYDSLQIPLAQKDFVVQMTDTYGEPDLVANHMAPLCLPFLNTADAMDFYATWKLFDALTDYAFFGVNGEYCLGNTPEQRFMGLWSDGTPVKELVVTDTP